MAAARPLSTTERDAWRFIEISDISKVRVLGRLRGTAHFTAVGGAERKKDTSASSDCRPQSSSWPSSPRADPLNPAFRIGLGGPPTNVCGSGRQQGIASAYLAGGRQRLHQLIECHVPISRNGDYGLFRWRSRLARVRRPDRHHDNRSGRYCECFATGDYEWPTCSSQIR
jgi:hypothetical protein